MKVSKNKRLIQQNDFTQNANVAELMIDSCVRSPGYEAKKKSHRTRIDQTQKL